MKLKISIVTPTFNEAKNIEELCDRIVMVMKTTSYEYEHLVIDNASTDDTVKILRQRAANDKNLKIIVNTRNFGHIRSPYYGLLQASGAATILISSDLQDPPEMIPELLEKWRAGYKIVMVTKQTSEESFFLSAARRAYYKMVRKISETPLLENSTGAGLYDSKIIEIIREIDDPYPYFRGLVCETGFPIAQIFFQQPKRKRGVSSQNFYSLFDIAMLGIVKHSKLPLRMMTFFGIFSGLISFMAALYYLLYKIFFWNTFDAGQAPLIVGLFFLISLLTIFLGLIGEYLISIHDQVRRIPHVIEKERINFDKDNTL